MRTPTTVWPAAFAAVAALATVVAATSDAQRGSDGATAARGDHAALGHVKHGGRLQERFLCVSTVAQSATDPDFIAVIGADPRRSDFGKIVNRIDMPNVGDELHHYGHSHDRKRLLVPGLFSNRIHVFDIKGNGKRLALRTVNDQLAASSGYVVPHGVMATSKGRAMVTMIGAGSESTQPGGIVDKTGRFVDHFGPGPSAAPASRPRSTCTTSRPCTARTAASARPSARRRASPGASPRAASAARSAYGTCAARR